MGQEDTIEISVADLMSERNEQAEEISTAKTHSPDTILDVFIESRGLTTIELRETILVEPDDPTKGVGPFEELFSTLYDAAMLKKIDDPAFVWIVTDSQSLTRVVGPLADNNRSLYRWLTNHTILATLPSEEAMMLALKERLFRPSREQFIALTTGRTNLDDSDLIYDAHFQPETQNGLWPGGPQCEHLNSPAKWLDNIVRDVHACHKDVLLETVAVEKNLAFQRLDGMKISTTPLKNLFTLS